MNRLLVPSIAAVALLAGCGGGDPGGSAQPVAARSSGASNGLSSDARRIAEARNLSPDDISAALKTYMPSGRHDDYVMFASSGHAGQVIAIGIPSMRILRTIAVYTPEPWQGWGYGVGNDVMAEGHIGRGRGPVGLQRRGKDDRHPLCAGADPL